jgi:hypothetical protein
MMEVNLQHRDYALIAQNSRVGKKLTSWISVVHRQDLQISVGAIALNIMSSDRSTTRIGFYILSVFLGMLAALSYTLSVESPQVVEAAAGDDIVGYAWSSNIGWLSMNSKNPGSGGGNYGVDVDNFGRLSGYAWSSNIGWVSFNAGDVSGCPGGGACQGQVNSDYTVSGWARALSPTGAVYSAKIPRPVRAGMKRVTVSSLPYPRYNTRHGNVTPHLPPYRTLSLSL